MLIESAGFLNYVSGLARAVTRVCINAYKLFAKRYVEYARNVYTRRSISEGERQVAVIFRQSIELRKLSSVSRNKIDRSSGMENVRYRRARARADDRVKHVRAANPRGNYPPHRTAIIDGGRFFTSRRIAVRGMTELRRRFDETTDFYL